MVLNSGKVPDIVREIDDSAPTVVDAGRRTAVPHADDQHCRVETIMFRREVLPIARAQVAAQSCEFEFLFCAAAFSADLTRRTRAIDHASGKLAESSPTRTIIDVKSQRCTAKIAAAAATSATPPTRG
ncbi:MAG TPA: hypothetical protein VII52_05230 [Gemmatimonadaceae bacterium]